MISIINNLYSDQQKWDDYWEERWVIWLEDQNGEMVNSTVWLLWLSISLSIQEFHSWFFHISCSLSASPIIISSLLSSSQMILINKYTRTIFKYYLIIILLILISFHLLFIFILFNHHIQSFSYHYYLKLWFWMIPILIKSSSFSYSISIDSISFYLFNQYQFTISNTLLQTNNQFIY